MPSLPSQIIIAILQLLVTTLQFFFMAFTWLSSRRSRPLSSQDKAEVAMDSQLQLDTLSVDGRSSTSQLQISSTQVPGVSSVPITVSS
ncbi:hypothetical protein F5Y08DRAFT_303841 [Xylaria arbuscula]|nr:hypothetical protein F5Y08DRAFT_303841 [Xylaria arbuscula]